MQPGSNWNFKSENDGQSVTPVKTGNMEPVKWSASEFIANEKSFGWYSLLGLGAALGAIVIYILTKDVISSGMIVVVAIALAVFGARKPRVLNYRVDITGVHIGEKHYPFADFKSFSVLEEGAINAIWLMPLKRFMPMITMYYDPADEDKIVDMLEQHLPFEDRQHDVVDKLMRKIRF